MVLAARTVGGLEGVDDRVRAGGSATLVPFDLREFIKIDELAAALTSAMAGSTSSSAMPPNSALFRRSATAARRSGARR